MSSRSCCRRCRRAEARSGSPSPSYCSCLPHSVPRCLLPRCRSDTSESFIPAYAAAMFVISSNAARVYFLVSSTLVLAVLLSETALLYARLDRSVMAESREREARLMTKDVLSASIAHEMNQPLASIVTNADAAARWMGRPAPDLD